MESPGAALPQLGAVHLSTWKELGGGLTYPGGVLSPYSEKNGIVGLLPTLGLTRQPLGLDSVVKLFEITSPSKRTHRAKAGL